jgi:hypothetical protein
VVDGQQLVRDRRVHLAGTIVTWWWLTAALFGFLALACALGGWIED